MQSVYVPLGLNFRGQVRDTFPPFPRLAKYKAFVQGQVARKYAPGEPFVYRYFAHADLPSDHEAVSLYHMLMTLSH